jgi:hypothetical protein
MKVDFENGQLFKTHNESSCFLLVLGHGPKKIMVLKASRPRGLVSAIDDNALLP